MEQHILDWITRYGYFGIFSLLMFGIVGLPVPDETLLAFTGYLIFRGNLSPLPAFLSALCGSCCGITLSYTLGRVFGLKLIHRYGRYLHLKEEHIEKAHGWFRRAGHWALTLGYFVPGVRHVTAYAAGMSDLEAPQFAVFAYSGAVLWISTFVGFGYYLGERWQAVEANFHHYAVICTIAAAILAAGWLIWKKWRR